MRELTTDVIANAHAQIAKALRSAVLPATFAPARPPPVALGELPASAPPPPTVRPQVPPVGSGAPIAPAPLPRISIDLPVTVPAIPGATSEPRQPAATNVGRFATLQRTPIVDPDFPFGHERK